MANLLSYNQNQLPENQLLDFIIKEYKGGDLTPRKAEAVECVLQDFFKQFPDSQISKITLKKCIGFYSKPCIMRGTSVHTNQFVRGDRTTVKSVEVPFEGYLEAYGSLIKTEFEGGVFTPLNLCFTPINTHTLSHPDYAYNIGFRPLSSGYGVHINIPYNLPRKVDYLPS